TGVKHKVKNGGTVADLAEMYKADAREIALFNGISVDTRLEAGMEILVPNGELHAEEKKPTSGSKVAKGSTGSKATGSTPKSSGNGFKNPVPGAVKTQGIHG